MKILSKTNQYYRGLCEGTTSPTKETGTNPNEIIDNGLELELIHQETQIGPAEASQMERCRQESRDRQSNQK